ncbi:MAG: DUF192 domain-containing protein [Opitutaceae bacterium]|nr:DUF192 domain-containing protein [Opitutaceae bacterium]
MLLGLACLWAGCSRAEPVKTVTPKTAADYFTIKVGEQPVRMQLAVLQPEMERGLMERRGLGQDEGMLFVYARPTQMSFWMHNTPTGLDIGFFSPEGELREIYPMYSFDETTVKSVGSRLQFALEMNQGWFNQNGVKPGAKLDLAALAAALRERGLDPTKVGLR